MPLEISLCSDSLEFSLYPELDCAIITYLWVEDSDWVEEPIRNHKKQHQHSKKSLECEDPRQACLRRPTEERPDGQQQYEQLEGHGDEEALAGRPAALQLLWPEDVRENQESQRCEEHKQAQDHRQSPGEVTAAVEPHAIFQVFGDASNVLLGEAVLWCACDSSGGLAPVVILKIQQKNQKWLTIITNIPTPLFNHHSLLDL